MKKYVGFDFGTHFVVTDAENAAARIMNEHKVLRFQKGPGEDYFASSEEVDEYAKQFLGISSINWAH